MCRSLKITLSEEGGYNVVTQTDSAAALAQIDQSLDLVLTDLSMPNVDGMAVLKRTKEVSGDIPVVIMTAYSTVESAVRAMKAGAFEYLIKPFSNDEILLAVQKALRVNQLQRENRWLRAQLHGETRGEQLIGKSAPMRELRFMIDRAAASEATVLITGESGTGKELVARSIHEDGPRASGPFVAINCAALAESLLESELFGHERGAFTGAVRTKIGRMEQAAGGTLFLDEIGDMTPTLQTKLLRALEERTFHRVGGLDEISVDVRFVAATNKDLEAEIAAGRFREDLYYRLNVVALRTPPLRERAGDVPLLVQHFLEAANRREGQSIEISPSAVELLCAQRFPGNVRQLHNVIERARLLCTENLIEPSDLPLAEPRRNRPKLDHVVDSLEGGWGQLHAVVKELERELVERAMSAYADRSNAEIAKILGTSRRVLELRLQEFEIDKRSRD
ncbi:MAG: sigma-54-dependent Fis family transcriptional regulator [Deltaproteobacteria bacterium]|nr:sigma-54-dependent Fis family transcriptional regulator [Deltaproteobacteria bacterium]